MSLQSLQLCCYNNRYTHNSGSNQPDFRSFCSTANFLDNLHFAFRLLSLYSFIAHFCSMAFYRQSYIVAKFRFLLVLSEKLKVSEFRCVQVCYIFYSIMIKHNYIYEYSYGMPICVWDIIFSHTCIEYPIWIWATTCMHMGQNISATSSLYKSVPTWPFLYI